MKEKNKSLDDLATALLRGKGFTWAGNDTSSPEFETIIDNRKLEQKRKIAGGMSTKKGGIISPRRKSR